MSKSIVDMFSSSQSSVNNSSVVVWGMSVWHAASFPILESDERSFLKAILGVDIRISESFTPWRHKCSTQLIVVLQVMLRFVLRFYASSEKDKKTNCYDPKCYWDH